MCAPSSTSLHRLRPFPESRAARARARRREAGRHGRRGALRRGERRRDGQRPRRRRLAQREAASPSASSSTSTTLVTALGEQESRVTDALEAFADNTLRHLRDEGRLLTEGIEFPPLKTRFRDRHAVVVARGPGYKRDLRIVRPYIRDFRPVLVAVDGGADALLEIGLKPHVIVGDFDSVSDAALRSGAELLVHAYADGRAPGSERLARARPRISHRRRTRDQRGHRAPARTRSAARS